MAISSKTREKLNEWFTWYNYHCETITQQPLEAQVAWLMKANQGAYEAFSLLARELNGEMQNDTTSGGILLPKGRF